MLGNIRGEKSGGDGGAGTPPGTPLEGKVDDDGGVASYVAASSGGETSFGQTRLVVLSVPLQDGGGDRRHLSTYGRARPAGRRLVWAPSKGYERRRAWGLAPNGGRETRSTVTDSTQTLFPPLSRACDHPTRTAVLSVPSSHAHRRCRRRVLPRPTPPHRALRLTRPWRTPSMRRGRCWQLLQVRGRDLDKPAVLLLLSSNPRRRQRLHLQGGGGEGASKRDDFSASEDKSAHNELSYCTLSCHARHSPHRQSHGLHRRPSPP